MTKIITNKAFFTLTMLMCSVAMADEKLSKSDKITSAYFGTGLMSTLIGVGIRKKTQVDYIKDPSLGLVPKNLWTGMKGNLVREFTNPRLRKLGNFLTASGFAILSVPFSASLFKLFCKKGDQYLTNKEMNRINSSYPKQTMREQS